MLEGPWPAAELQRREGASERSLLSVNQRRAENAAVQTRPTRWDAFTPPPQCTVRTMFAGSSPVYKMETTKERVGSLVREGRPTPSVPRGSL